MRVELDEAALALVVRRGPIDLHLNLGDEPRTADAVGRRLLLASADGIVLRDGELTLPPESVAVLG